ncbi:MAG: Ig-like domain-containing protein, partial [Oscillospiraceae bacterium]|nr:Ig-like domain-containing protein [Oscillospiraceae bacterium]
DEALLMKNPAPNSTSVTADTIEIIGPKIVYVGHPITFAYKLTPADSNDTITWSSSDTAIATVAQDGTVTGVSAGSVDVKASGDNSSRTETITVKVPVNVIQIDDASLELGGTLKLNPVISPDNAADKTVTWLSSDTAVATVAADGTVTGLKEGSVTITATAADEQGATDTATITVTPIKVKKINITGAELIKVKEETTLTATVLPSTAENRTIEWSSDKPSVATVDKNGVVKGESTGTAIITATAKDGSGVSKGYMVYVQNTYTPYIYADRQTLYVGDTVSVELRHATFKNFTDVNWTFSRNDDEVEASGSGTKISVKAKKAGGVGISVKYDSNEGNGTITNGIYLTILSEDQKPAPVPVTGIEISGPDAVLAGDTIPLTAAVTPEYADDTSVTWTSSDDTTATVDGNGVVTGVKAGTVTITATANGGANVSATHSVTVEEIAVSIDGENSVYIGKSTTLIATVTPEGLTDRSVRWSSKEEDIATVDPATGEVTGVAVGKVTITATSNADPDKSATHEIEVKAILVTEIQISGDSAVLVGSTIDLDAAITPDDASDKTLTWSSSRPDIATVDEKGVVKGVNAGTVKITATSNADPTKSASKEITVTAPSLTVSGPRTVAVGNTITLTAKVSPDEVTDKTVTWTSSDSTIATVDKNGVVRGVKTGEVVRIKATSNYDSKLSAEHSVRVIAPVYLYYGNGTHFNGIHAMPFVSSDLWAGGAGVSVVINGIPLVPGRDFSCYSSPHGMIGVTVNPGMLRLLPQNAWHSIEIISANGIAAGSFSTGYFGSYNIYGVKTGDDSTPLLWAALCLLGISGAGIILVKSRKRKA